MNIKNLALGTLIVATAFSTSSCNFTGKKDQKYADSVNMMSSRLDEDMQQTVSTSFDAVFVSDVIVANAKELAWINAGINNGHDKDLVEDAKKMQSDHMALGQQMHDYAMKKGYTLPNVDTSDVVNLTAKKGKEWDKAWADKMVSDHESTIEKFKNAGNKVSAQELKDMISKTIPSLQNHLDMCKKLQGKLM